MRYPVSIKGVLFYQNKVVLVKNDRQEWELPGGRIELNETPEHCLAREIKEELSLNVTVGTIIDSCLFEVISSNYVFVVSYHCVLKSQFKPRLSHEHNELGLFSLGALESIPLPKSYLNAIQKV